MPKGTIVTLEELKTLIKQLGNHLRHIQEEQDDHTLQAARYSQTESRKTNGGPSEPLSIDRLDYTIEEIEERVKAWCYSLANYYTIGGMPHDQRASVWAAWLAARAKLLLETDYADLTIEEIQSFETELRHAIYPDGKYLDLPEIAPIDQLAHTFNKKPDTMRKWCERHEITRYTMGGKVHYKTSEVISQIAATKNN